MAMKWIKAFALCLFTTASINAYGLKSESQKSEDRFIFCLLAMEEANANEDERLSKEEYQPFLRSFSKLLFKQDVIQEDEELPGKLDHIYNDLVQASGAPAHDNSIDIFGASAREIFLNAVSEERLQKLHKVCDIVLKELALFGPENEPPLFLLDGRTEDSATKEDKHDIKDTPSQGDIDIPQSEEKITTEMVSVHSSFLVANFLSLTEHDLDLSQDGILYDAYMDFIDDLLENVCSMGLPCPNSELAEKMAEDQTKQGNKGTTAHDHSHDHDHDHNHHSGNDPHHHHSSHSSAHDSHHHHHRRLCGEMRRMLCGTENRRRLVKEALVSDADLYEAKEHPCPLGFQRHEHETNVRPICHTIYGHYDVLVEYSGPDIEEVEHNYAFATQTAISDGMLEEAMQRVDPSGTFTVLGAGEHPYPVEDKKSSDGKAERPSHHQNGHGRNL